MTPLHKLSHAEFLTRRYGSEFWLCLHRSHRLRLPCFRHHRWDGYCARHNDHPRGACPSDRDTS